MKYELLLVPYAESEVDRIIRYLVKRSPQGAIAWCERWEQVLAELGDDPLKFGLAPESTEYNADVRQILFKTRRGRTYRALFTVVGRGVFTSSMSAGQARIYYVEIKCDGPPSELPMAPPS
jgi:plasmid stabilization system protein ParE